jgi:hypothetical protein
MKTVAAIIATVVACSVAISFLMYYYNISEEATIIEILSDSYISLVNGKALLHCKK